MEFSKKLKEIRKNKNVTQEELANLINVSRSLVARWEYGDVYPSEDNLDLLSKVLNVSIDELIDKEEKKNVIKIKEKLSVIKVNKKIKQIIYIIVTLFSTLLPLFYFCKIYWVKSYDFSSGNPVEKIIFYAPIEGIDIDYIWVVFVSFFINILLLIYLNVFTFRKKDLTVKILKLFFVIVFISIFLSVLVFIMGTFNPPRLK